MKPREFWVLNYPKPTLGGNNTFEAFDYKLNSGDAIPLIEKAAYSELLAEFKAVISVLEEIGKPVALDQHILSRPLDNMAQANEANTKAKQFLEQLGEG